MADGALVKTRILGFTDACRAYYSESLRAQYQRGQGRMATPTSSSLVPAGG